MIIQWDNQEPGEGVVQADDPGNDDDDDDDDHDDDHDAGGRRVLQRPCDRRGWGPRRQPQEDEGEKT